MHFLKALDPANSNMQKQLQKIQNKVGIREKLKMSKFTLKASVS